jgi:hypothetical protein
VSGNWGDHAALASCESGVARQFGGEAYCPFADVPEQVIARHHNPYRPAVLGSVLNRMAWWSGEPIKTELAPETVEASHCGPRRYRHSATPGQFLRYDLNRMAPSHFKRTRAGVVPQVIRGDGSVANSERQRSSPVPTDPIHGALQRMPKERDRGQLPSRASIPASRRLQ